ncbi:MAG: glycosyltransferase family 1 protein [Chitinophagia bacterium]|jgi:glycosyltransferase involved in cell wall biosynthesis
MKVAIDIRNLQIAQTGVKTYLTQLIQAWEKIPNATICLIEDPTKVYTGKNMLLKFLEHIRFQIWKQITLPQKAKQQGCTHLFCADFFVPYFKQGLKTIVVLHDAFFWQTPSNYNFFWLQIFHRIGVPAAKKANLIIVPSYYTQKKLLEYESFDSEKIKVVYEASQLFKQSDLENDYQKYNPYFLHIGVLEKRKNLPLFIKAFKIVSQKYPNYKILLAGNTPTKQNLNDRDHILQTIIKQGLENKVKLLGYVDAPQAAALYQNAFAYVLPSKNEGFGLPLLEAFSFGTPVISSTNGALPEVGQDAAYWVNLEEGVDESKAIQNLSDAMMNMIQNESLRQSFIEKGKQRNFDFSWDKAAKEINELIVTH